MDKQPPPLQRVRLTRRAHTRPTDPVAQLGLGSPTNDCMNPIARITVAAMCRACDWDACEGCVTGTHSSPAKDTGYPRSRALSPIHTAASMEHGRSERGLLLDAGGRGCRAAHSPGPGLEGPLEISRAGIYLFSAWLLLAKTDRFPQVLPHVT